MDENTSVEISGLSDSPATVASEMNVTQGGAGVDQDVMADMRAAVALTDF